MFVKEKDKLSFELGALFSPANSELQKHLLTLSLQKTHYHLQLMQRSYSKACKINSIAMSSGLKMLINVALWTVG